MNLDYDVKEIFSQFDTNAQFISCEKYGNGHINDTYKITSLKDGVSVPFILQRINNTLFTDVDKLMNNISLVSNFVRKNIIKNGGNPNREALTFVRTLDGKPYYNDGQNCFRVYIFIENATTYQIVSSANDFYESAVAFGNFAKLLANFDATQLYEVIPNFHNTKIRYQTFEKAVKNDKAKRGDTVKKEIEWAREHKYLCGKIVDKIESGEIPLRVTHNDTKLNNVMIDDETGKGLCVIDLDTVMPGSYCYDFGDSIRFGCNPADEDEPNLSKVNFNFDLFKTYTDGYLSAVGDALTKIEKENLAMGAIVMTYECGIRFLSDYLDGDVYFKTHRENQNLDRAHTQFKLVDDMLKIYDKMQAYVLSK